VRYVCPSRSSSTCSPVSTAAAVSVIDNDDDDRGSRISVHLIFHVSSSPTLAGRMLNHSLPPELRYMFEMAEIPGDLHRVCYGRFS